MTVLGFLAIGMCLRVAISDLYARRVPNTWLLAALSVGALVMAVQALQGEASPPVLQGVLGLLIGLVALLPFYVVRWMGAGDVKFFAVLGFLLGWTALLPIWVGASLLAGMHVLVIFAARGAARFMPVRLLALQQQTCNHPAIRQMQQARQGRVGIPYAAYLAFAAISWLLWSYYGGATP